MTPTFRRSIRPKRKSLILAFAFLGIFLVDLSDGLSQAKALPQSSCKLQNLIDCQSLEKEPAVIDTGGGTSVVNFANPEVYRASIGSSGTVRFEAGDPVASGLEDRLENLEIKLAEILSPKNNAWMDEKSYRTVAKYGRNLLDFLARAEGAAGYVNGELAIASPPLGDQFLTLPTASGPRRVNGNNIESAVMQFLGMMSSKTRDALQGLIKSYVQVKIDTMQYLNKRKAPYIQPSTPEKTKADLARITKVFETVKATLVGTLKEIFGSAELTAAQSAMLEKIKTIKFNGNNHVCENELNAFYEPASHSFSICSGFNTLSESNLVGLLTHELAHAIDPCQANSALYKFDKKKIDTLRMSPTLSDSERKNPYYYKKLDAISQISIQSPQEEAYLKQMVDKGLVTQLAASIPPENYPFRALTQCLEKSLELTTYSKAQQDLKLKQFNRSLQTAGGAGLTPSAQQSTSQRLSRLSSCDYSVDQRSEAFADALSARGLGQFLKGKPAPKTTSEKMNYLGLFATLACKETTIARSGFVGLDAKTVSQTGATTNEIDNYLDIVGWMGLNLNDGHLLSTERMNQIYLQEPELRRLAGCKTTPDHNCLTTAIRKTGDTSTPQDPSTTTGDK